MSDHEPRAESRDETMCLHCTATVLRFQDYCDADCEACDREGDTVECSGRCGKAAR
jgi:hypothetical protein